MDTAERAERYLPYLGTPYHALAEERLALIAGGEPTTDAHPRVAASVRDELRDTGVAEVVVALRPRPAWSIADELTVANPGAAAWAFPMGATLNSASIGNYLTVRTGPICTDSSRGGAQYLFGSRAIIGMMSPGVGALVPDANNVYRTSEDGECGTSWSAPLAAGLAVDFIDFMLASGTYEPLGSIAGMVQADLMLMGDRYSETGTYRQTGQDELWGGGRLRARMFTNAGMDAPWGWQHGRLTAWDGTNYLLQVNGGDPLPADVDRLRAVIWWPEPFLTGGNGADITARLRRFCGSGPEASDLSYDPRKMVYLASGVGGSCYALEIAVWSASSNPWNGNQMTRRVFYAWYYEDDDRDDADGPPPDIQ